jgi:hypothetical protein
LGLPASAAKNMAKKKPVKTVVICIWFIFLKFSYCLESLDPAFPKELSVSYSLSILDHRPYSGTLSGMPREFPITAAKQAYTAHMTILPIFSRTPGMISHFQSQCVQSQWLNL